MAKFNSRVSVFQTTDTGGTLRDLSQYISEVSGLPGARDLNEVTALGDTGEKNIVGLARATVTISGHFDDTATTGPDAVLGPLVETDSTPEDTARAFDYGPKGTTGGFVKYSGTIKWESYEVTSRVGDIVAWTATGKVQGNVTRGTY